MSSLKIMLNGWKSIPYRDYGYVWYGAWKSHWLHSLLTVFKWYGEQVAYVCKDYLSMWLGSHIGYIGCGMCLNGMVNWQHMSVKTIFLCCLEVTLVTDVANGV